MSEQLVLQIPEINDYLLYILEDEELPTVDVDALMDQLLETAEKNLRYISTSREIDRQIKAGELLYSRDELTQEKATIVLDLLTKICMWLNETFVHYQMYGNDGKSLYKFKKVIIDNGLLFTKTVTAASNSVTIAPRITQLPSVRFR